MENSLKLFVILNFLGVAQALLLAAALLSIKRGNRIANRILAAFVATIAVSIGLTALDKTIYASMFPHLNKIQIPFFFLGAPLLFLYIKSLISKKESFESKNLLHFVPFCLCLIYMLPFYLKPGEAKLDFYSNYYGRQSYLVRTGLLLAQFLIYLSLTASIIISYSKRVKPQTSASDKAILFQVRFLMATFLVIWIAGAVIYLIQYINPTYTVTTDLIIPIGLSAFVYVMSYLGLRKPEVLAGVDDAPAPPSPKRYKKSTLTSERGDDYLKRLLDVMLAEKPYLDNDLTLQKLAKAVAVSPHHLSQTINERLEQNFFDFINGYRIEEAKNLLGDPAKKHYSILAVAEAVGFNSKSAFNAAFKKHAKLTPSEFRKIADGNSKH